MAAYIQSYSRLYVTDMVALKINAQVHMNTIAQQELDSLLSPQ